MTTAYRKIETKILSPLLGSTIPLPSYATDGAAGMDIRACLVSAVTIAPGATEIIDSGLAISIRDPGLMAVLVPRSGLGIKHGIVLANTVGIIDSCYQGEIKVGVWNRGDQAFTIQPGDRICQLLFVPVAQVELEIVAEFRATTVRGEGGLGHTGLR